MKERKTIQELAAEVQRQANAKVDYLAPGNKLLMTARPSVEGTSYKLGLLGGGQTSWLMPNENFHTQLATKQAIPKVYYDRMRKQTPTLFIDSVNTWFRRDEKVHMVRTLDGNARAYLSDKYRRLDNHDLLEAVLPPILDLGLEVVSCEVTDTRLYLQCIDNKVRGEVKVGDEICAGFQITNSEVGMGRLLLDEFIWRLVCKNGMKSKSILAKYHVGGKAADVFDDVQEYFKDSTKKLDDAAFFSKVRDTVQYAVSVSKFNETLQRLQGAASVKIKAVESIEMIQNTFKLSDVNKTSLLNHLAEGGDFSIWGMANAVTRMAHDVEDYDAGIEWEAMGHQVIELHPSAWREVLAAA